jgi:hypothetical protein
MSVYPVHGQPPVTAHAMRVAADLIEISGVTGLSVTCSDDQISIQVCAPAGDADTRAALVARLARLLGGTAARHASPTGNSWIRAHGVAGTLPVQVYTPTEAAAATCAGAGQAAP